MVMVYQRFILAKETIDLLKQLPNPFEDNPFGEIVFYRTYSRIKLDAKNTNKNVGQETWLDIVIRVIQGTFSIRKDWYIKNNIHWDEKFWQNYAKLMAIAMYKMEWLPPGRGLWAMGTDFVYEEGSMCLQNCGFTIIGDDIAEDIGWLMDALMLGVGVGFEPIRNNEFKIYLPKGYFDYIIPDSREGWVESVKLLINAYYKPNQKEPRFSYDEIRPAGSLIKRFGGICSGPDSLKLFHDQIRYSFYRYHNYIHKLNDLYYDIIMLKTDLANYAGCCVVSGNVRRSAELCKGSIQDKTFLELKQYENPVFAYRINYGWMSNNSVALYEDEDFNYLSEIANRIKIRAEPGVMNLRNFIYGRIGKKGIGREKEKDLGNATNPCMVGDTKICVADGRGFVTIKTLVDENKDVDVYCINEQDEVVIRRLRNPRLTGHKQKILKIVFDSGDFIRVTENHKIMLLDRTFVEARNLYQGAAVAMFNRYVPEDSVDESYADKYIGLGYSGIFYIEHRLIAENYYNRLIETYEHIHHKDSNRLNNDPTNLEIKQAEKHLIEDTKGENNPNYSGYSNDMLIAIGVTLCKKLGRRFSTEEWQQNSPVQQFSNWRVRNLGTVYEFSIMCAELAGVDQYSNLDPRIVKRYQDMISQGYEASINELTFDVEVIKVCEACNNEFWISSTRREQACCSLSCNNKLRDYTKATESNRKIWAKKKETLKEKQLDIFLQLKQDLERVPSKDEWMAACKEEGISSENGRESSPFKTWSALKRAASNRNHRVSLIIEDGYEDVYNGTVDDYHNYIIGGWEEKNDFGRLIQRGIITPQCGEQVLENKEVCTLADTLPTRCEDSNIWLNSCEYATFYAHTVTLLPTHQVATNKVMLKNRRIGIGIIDFIGWKYKLSVHEITRLLRKGYKRIRKVAKQLSEEAGIPEPIRVTTMKPNGTTAKVAGRRSGAGYSGFRYMLRRIRVQQYTKFYNVLCKANISHEPDLYSANTEIFEYPIDNNDGTKTAEEVTLWEQIMNIILLQREWSDNSVSNTIMFKPKWILQRHIIGLQECADYQENITWAVTGYSVTKDCYEDKHIKIVVIRNNNNQPIDIKEYTYNPKHEEDDVEPALSAAIPLVKTLTMMPHTPKGVYTQTPEVGITKAEYERRMAQISPIDWSEFINEHNIETDKYCSGDSCQLS
jgi:hypothetical protein